MIEFTISNTIYLCIKRTLCQTDTIIGLLKGFSKLSINEAETVFYLLNPKKNYKVSDQVIIPIQKKEEFYE